MRRAGSAILAEKIEIAMKEGLISNNEKYGASQILGVLRDHQGVIYQERMRKGKKGSPVYTPINAALKIVMELVLDDCEQYNREHSSAALIRCKDIDFLIEEYDQYAPESEETTTKEFFRELMTKERKTGVHVGLVAQEAELVDTASFSQCQFRFVSKLTKQNAKVFRGIQMSSNVIKRLFQLSWKTPTSVGITSVQWALSYPGGLIKFYVVPSCSDFMRREDK